ncbi:diguanylate cyclase (GGDEF) domain-containing protein [Lentzea fradiae]|uniref:Diguanylate cyclase (GGDEF) domain-containing protein n=1 Tax=Lentzea fradiae TaxID=200378 RepID=A0A1G8A6P0_9PSEU|nr:GGDEF domain-containing protein [Lentzea fradiae]SDH16645.1 diguanylate cyclase (GGDEF) domain-containing protein [Lentzea fradiae]
MSTTNTILLTSTVAATAGYLVTSAYAVHLFSRLHIDGLTSLGNREALGILARRAASRRPGSVGLLLLDVDNFKAINDTHGHAVGDAVLKVLATRLDSLRLPGERAVRLHGDEFVLWLGAVPSDERGRQAAAHRVAAVRTALTKPIVLGGLRLNLAVSIGAHTLPTRDLQLSALLAGADAAMYVDKHGRRLTSLPANGRLRDHRPGRESA